MKGLKHTIAADMRFFQKNCHYSPFWVMLFFRNFFMLFVETYLLLVIKLN